MDSRVKPVRAGIIGFGRMAESWHLPRMQKLDVYDVVAVCDVTEARCRAAQEAGLKATADLSEFLSWDIEMALVATPSAHHHAGALKAAEAGKHLLVDKPMAVTAEQAEEMIAAARANNVALSVYHNRHFDPDYRMVKAAVQEGLLGELVAIENRAMDSEPAVTFGTADYDPAWRISARAGGGVLMDFGPHWIEQVVDLMAGQKIVQVFGDVRNVKWGDAPDLFRIEMIFENDVHATVGQNDIAYYSLPDKWLILGTKASLHAPLEWPCPHVIINGPDYELRRSTAAEEQSLHVNFAEHVRQGKDLIITPEHALRVMKVMQAGIDSARAGKSVDVCI